MMGDLCLFVDLVLCGVFVRCGIGWMLFGFFWI